MIESNKEGLTIFSESTKLVGDTAVSICFELKCNGCAFNRFGGKIGCSNQCFPSGSEEAALGYALALAVRQALCGDPLAVSKTKVGSVECVAHNGHLGINWKVKSTETAIRKSIGIALKTLNPASMFQIYSKCIEQLGGSANKKVFNFVAEAAAKSIKSNLTVGIIGNSKINSKDQLDLMLEVLAKKINLSDVKGDKTQPVNHTPCDHSAVAEIPVLGYSSAVLADFIRSKVKGLDPIICDKYLIIPISKQKWQTIANKLKKVTHESDGTIKDAIKEFAQTKYAKVGEDLPAVFGYLNIASGRLCASDVKSAISSKLSAASIESLIRKRL